MKTYKIRVIRKEGKKYQKRAVPVKGFAIKLLNCELPLLCYRNPFKNDRFNIWKVAEISTGISLSNKGFESYLEAIEDAYNLIDKDLKTQGGLIGRIIEEREKSGLVRDLKEIQLEAFVRPVVEPVPVIRNEPVKSTMSALANAINQLRRGYNSRIVRYPSQMATA